MSDEINIETKSKKTKLFIIIAAVVIVFFTVGAVIFAMSKSATAKKVEKQLSLGEKYLSELDYEQAIVAYELAIEIDPKNADAYIGLADVYVAMGDYEKAEEILEEAKGKVEEVERRLLEGMLEAIAQKKSEEEKPEVTLKPTLTPTLMPTVTPEPAATPMPTPSTLEVALMELSYAEVGDYVTFGAYEQDNVLEDGAEPIEWLVLDKKDGKALLLSKYALDVKAYNEDDMEITWESCTLRAWLNNEFYHKAFSKTEQASIVESLVTNPDNSVCKSEGGNDTVDRLFLLSLDELTTYFGANLEEKEISRCVEVTTYARERGAYCYNHDGVYYGLWRLRTPGISGGCTAGIDNEGKLFYGGDVEYSNYVVRPALWVAYLEQEEVVLPAPTVTPTPKLTPMPTKEPEEITDISWFEYEETENGNIRIVGLKAGAPEKIVVPRQIEGKKVTEIMDYAFLNCDLTEVFLPASIEKIGIGAMGSNSRLKSINIAEENKDFMEKNGVLFSADGTELIQVPGGFEEKSYSIPDGTVKVKHKAFSYCINISNIIIAESVKEIESTAFEGCYNLVEIRIPKGVEKIEESPFSYCDALEKIVVDEENQYYSSYNGALYNKEKTELIQLPRKVETEVYKIFDGVKVIGHSACIATDYVGIDLPEGLETIRHGAFWGTRMKEIRLPEGLCTIESCSFAYCDLNKVEIPASVTFISGNAFMGAPNVMIYTTKGSYADTYAQENNIPVSYK